MNWHSATVDPQDLQWLLETIRRLDGTVVGSRPDHDKVRVTWTVAPAPASEAG